MNAGVYYFLGVVVLVVALYGVAELLFLWSFRRQARALRERYQQQYEARQARQAHSRRQMRADEAMSRIAE